MRDGASDMTGSSIREFLYNTSLEAGLFGLVQLAAKLPDAAAWRILRLKARIRYLLGSYRSYVDRPHLKELALTNISGTLGINKEDAGRILFRLMLLEVISERNGFLLDTYTRDSLENLFDVRGLDFLDRELKHGKGVILATIHSGDTLLFLLFLALKGYPIFGLFDESIASREAKNPLEKLARVKDQKIEGKIGKLYAGGGMKKVFDVLKENGIILWMVDLPASSDKRRVVVDFLGRRIAINGSFWEAAHRSGASLLPHADSYDFDSRRHVVRIGRPVDTSESSPGELFHFYEESVRESPESWIGWYLFDILRVD